jgi:hypothetical protein
MAGYFSYFPRTTYANTVCVDLFRRSAVRDSVRVDQKAYLPYEVRAGERPDEVARYYYDDPQNDWMVYLSAGIVDPYYSWHLPEDAFVKFVEDKYGSWEIASEKVRHWQLNWHATDQELTPSAYAALEPNIKKYFEAVYGVGSSVISYERRSEDWTASTNMVVRVEGTLANSSSTFSTGDLVYVKTGVTTTGQAEVAWANSTVLKLIHVTGNTDATNLIVGRVDSTANLTITDREYVSNTIPVDERDYWSAVTCLEWERDKNEQRKNIRLVDRKYTSQMRDELAKLQRE